MTQDQIFKLIEDNGLTLHGDIEHFAALVAVVAVEEQLAQREPIGYLCENAVGHKYFRWKKPPSTYKPIALYK